MASLKEQWLSGVDQTEKGFLGRWKKSTVAGKTKIVASLALLTLMFLYIGSNFFGPAERNVLDDVSGVWRFQSGMVAKIDLSGASKRIRLILPSMGNQTIGSLTNCKTRQIDRTNNILFLSCLEDSQEPVQTMIRQIFSKDNPQSFSLVVSSNDKPEEALSFVRNLDPNGN